MTTIRGFGRRHAFRSRGPSVKFLVTFPVDSRFHVRQQHLLSTLTINFDLISFDSLYTFSVYVYSIPYAHNITLTGQFSGPGRAIDPVCLCIRTLTFELNGLQPIYVNLYIILLKLIREGHSQSSWSKDEKIFLFRLRIGNFLLFMDAHCQSNASLIVKGQHQMSTKHALQNVACLSSSLC